MTVKPDKNIIPVEIDIATEKNEISLKAINLILGCFPTSVFENIVIGNGYVLGRSRSGDIKQKMTFGSKTRKVSMDDVNINLKALENIKSFVKENIPVCITKEDLNDENDNSIIHIRNGKTEASYITSKKPVTTGEYLYVHKDNERAVVAVSRTFQKNPENKCITWEGVEYKYVQTIIIDAKPVSVYDLKMSGSVVKTSSLNDIKISIVGNDAIIQYSTIAGSTYELRTSVTVENKFNKSFNVYFSDGHKEQIVCFNMLSDMFNGNFTIIQDLKDTDNGSMNYYYIIAKNESATVEIMTTHEDKGKTSILGENQNSTPKADDNISAIKDNISAIL